MWRFYVLERVFLQRATHLGTQTECLLAKYEVSRERPECHMNAKLHGHAVQDRSANELPAETQTLCGHDSAPQATQTLQFRLNRSPQPGENTYA